jgi:hypothetical protein
MTGQLILASFEQLRLEIGIPGFLTSSSFQEFKVLITPSWLTDLWDFLQRFGIKLHDQAGQLLPQRKNDKFLMDEFRTQFRGLELKQLNECRMFLHAVTLSDIVSANGQEITINSWEGRQEELGQSRYTWPRIQRRLPDPHWKLWRRALQRTVLSRNTSRHL